MDVETHTHHEHREGDDTERKRRKYEDKPEEDDDSEQHGYQDEEDGADVPWEKLGLRMTDQTHVEGGRTIRRSMQHMREDWSPKQRLLE